MALSRIEMVREVVEQKQAKRIRIDGKKIYLDLFTASAIIQVHDNLNDENRAKFAAMPLVRQADVAFKLIKQMGAA